MGLDPSAVSFQRSFLQMIPCFAAAAQHHLYISNWVVINSDLKLAINSTAQVDSDLSLHIFSTCQMDPDLELIIRNQRNMRD